VNVDVRFEITEKSCHPPVPSKRELTQVPFVPVNLEFIPTICRKRRVEKRGDFTVVVIVCRRFDYLKQTANCFH